MVNINPKKIVEDGIISNIVDLEKQVQQVGIDLTCKHDFNIPHGSFVNFEFNETFDMKDCFGLLKIRSSFARMGLIMTSGVYDPGFKGNGGCVIVNMSGVEQSFKAGTRVGQMVCFKSDAASDYNGHYNNNDTIESQYKEEE